MNVKVIDEPIRNLHEYGNIPIAFEVRRILEVTNPSDGSNDFVLTERPCEEPYLVKNYDAIKGEDPATWATRFDVSNWRLFSAWLEGRCIARAVVAFDTPGLDMLEGRKDLVVLWDIRVAPGSRGQGVGFALFKAVERWATLSGCSQLKVETQNINVPANRFYARQGCVLTAVNRSVYPEFMDEIQLLWLKDLK